MNIQMIALDAIQVGHRLRVTDAAYTDFLAASIRESGLMSPLQVRADGERFALVAGAHRLAALASLGKSEAPCLLLDCDQVQAELREIDENLVRRELDEMDRAAFLARRKEIWEALHPAVRHGGKRRGPSPQIDDLISRFTKVTAERLGLSEATIQRSVRRWQKIAPDVRQQLAGTKFAQKGSDLDALCRLEPADQRRCVAFLLDGAPGVTDALRRMRGVPDLADSPDRPLIQIQDRWARLSPEHKRRFLQALADEGVLKGLKASRSPGVAA